MPTLSAIPTDRRADHPRAEPGLFPRSALSRRFWIPRLLLTCVVLSFPAWCGAQAYKGVDAEGRVIYSDQPLPDAEAIPLPRRSSGENAGQETGEDAGQQGAMLGPYEQFAVVAPSAGETLESAEGKVQVSLMLSPPLETEHKLAVQVDGTPVDGLNGRTQFQLQGLPPGSHQVQAQILDPTGAVLAQTALLSFNLLTTPTPADQP
ncbi:MULTISPECIES: DUF4124 domain-containing protein [Thiorhodovibrio]|uniref:DUF4124 domain-containing protein n=1 Tax=Thiorhodovibrio TaxID=61593 RepID=UPI001914A199|nr:MULTISPECIES: DUF4124 domain-containing protein [Thiorhodovibrio]MBK5971055.1 hypothetical protein [Thiorhodovibrio winogradskyi]WPL10578.1 hypothetical protein Thiosp_00294 [Thiorhodovibrio litoralis]